MRHSDEDTVEGQLLNPYPAVGADFVIWLECVLNIACTARYSDRAVQPDGDRSVIDQFHRHMGSKTAGFDGDTIVFHTSAEVFVKLPRNIGWRRPGKPGPISSAGIGGQGELTNDQRFAADIPKGSVHTAVVVLEYTNFRDLCREGFGGYFVISRDGTDEDQQAMVDLAYDHTFDRDACCTNPLEKCPHCLPDALEHSLRDFIPFRSQGIGGFRTSGFAVPVAGIRQIAFDAVEISMHPGAGHSLVLLCGDMRGLPVSLCGMPKGQQG